MTSDLLVVAQCYVQSSLRPLAPGQEDVQGLHDTHQAVLVVDGPSPPHKLLPFVLYQLAQEWISLPPLEVPRGDDVHVGRQEVGITGGPRPRHFQQEAQLVHGEHGDIRRTEHRAEPVLQEVLKRHQLILILVSLIPRNRLEFYRISESLSPHWK